MKILLELSYIGTGFAGFQVQPDKATVQSAIQDAIEAVYGERYDVKGTSRTDAGVHALQFFATFETEREIPLDRLPLALNNNCDPRLAFISAREVPEEFHVRHDVKLKEYEYVIRNSPIPDPFQIRRYARIAKPLSSDQIALMRRASEQFLGKHDYCGFMSSGSSVVDTVREIYYLEIIEDGDYLRIRIAANGFLYNMVRIIVGTLIDVARKRIDIGELCEIIASKSRCRAGFTAPPEGLYLRRIEFNSDL